MLRKLAAAAGLAIALFIVYVTLCPIQDRPQTGYPDAERFAAFFLLGVAFAAAFPRRRIAVALVVAVGACLLEATQGLVPGRDAHVQDALVKVLGVIAGVIVAFVGEAAVALVG